MEYQMSLFDLDPDELTMDKLKGDEVGAYRKKPGSVIPHIMRAAYIGKKVLIDVSTRSQELYRIGILEDYFYNVDAKAYRCIVYTGQKQRSLINMVPGVEIFEMNHLARFQLARQNLEMRLWRNDE